MRLSHQTKVRIALTGGAIFATGGTIAILVFPALAVQLHISSALAALATNVVWIWEDL